MRLSELNQNPVTVAVRALRENYSVDLDVGKLDITRTSTMLKKVRALLGELRESSHSDKQSRMKLVFMEQALSAHLSSLRARAARVVFENEEVDKSQAVLAAQDMVDTVQKMMEQVSDMLVKELPALVDSIQSDIGVNEGEQFNQQVSEGLKALQDALTQSRTTLSGALGMITGQGGGEQAFDSGVDDMGAGEDLGELPPEGSEDLADIGGEEDLGELPAEEPEELEAPEPAVGRQKR